MKFKLLSTKELRAKKAAELDKYLAELRQNYTDLHHAVATNKDKQTHQLGQIKKTVARVNTILSEQEVTTEKEKK
jgi:large subunit ribosomal protein L29